MCRSRNEPGDAALSAPEVFHSISAVYNYADVPSVTRMTKAVLWDLDGTLVDSEQYHWFAWRDRMAAEGVTLTHEQFLKTFGLRNDAIVPQWIAGVTPERIDHIAREKEKHYRRLVRGGGQEHY